MLEHLSVRNFAIIEHIDLDLSNGMTVFSGETGAGKSLIVDALGFLLGARAEASLNSRRGTRMFSSRHFLLFLICKTQRCKASHNGFRRMQSIGSLESQFCAQSA